MVNNLYTLTLLKAIHILDCFADDSQEIGIKEIADRIDMPQSSVYRIIQSLEFAGMIFQDQENRKYRIGLKLLELSGKCGQLQEYLRISERHLQQLAQETGETVNLAMASCDKIMYLSKVESRHVLRPSFSMDEVYPIYSTSLGRIFLAEMSEASLRWIYDNDKDEMDMSFEDLCRIARDAKRLGYAYDDQEFSPGLRCVAAPVRGPGGKALFSLSVSAPVVRMDDRTYEKARDLAVAHAKAASDEIRALG